MKWKIGNVEIDNQIALAPMAGVCDSAFRTIVKSMGCGLIETEMVSDKAIMYGNWKTMEMLYMTDYERPISQQIVGSDLESLTFASKYIWENTNVDIIDINMGCPVAKVTNRSKAGCSLMRDPLKVKSIVESIVDIIDIPLTVKIRSGWDKDNVNAVEIAQIAEEAGASAITVHPRTKDQGYSGKADWNIGESGFKTREGGFSRSFSGCVRKPCVPSTCAGDLRELLRVPLRSRDTVDLGGASRASTVFGVMEEGLISSGVRNLRVPLHFGLRSQGPFRVGTGESGLVLSGGMELCLPLELFMG